MIGAACKGLVAVVCSRPTKRHAPGLALTIGSGHELEIGSPNWEVVREEDSG